MASAERVCTINHCACRGHSSASRPLVMDTKCCSRALALVAVAVVVVVVVVLLCCNNDNDIRGRRRPRLKSSTTARLDDCWPANTWRRFQVAACGKAAERTIERRARQTMRALCHSNTRPPASRVVVVVVVVESDPSAFSQLQYKFAARSCVGLDWIARSV